MSDKIFVGSATQKDFQNGGNVLTVHLECDNLEKYFNEYGYINKAGKHVVKLKISKRREIGKHGESHYVEIDTWKPDPAYSGQSRQPYQQNARTAPERDFTPGERAAMDDARQEKMFHDDLEIPFF